MYTVYTMYSVHMFHVCKGIRLVDQYAVYNIGDSWPTKIIQ